jgi:hypothetical protein
MMMLALHFGEENAWGLVPVDVCCCLLRSLSISIFSISLSEWSMNSLFVAQLTTLPINYLSNVDSQTPACPSLIIFHFNN